MSLSSRRAWFSWASSPVRANSSRRWWPGSATRVVSLQPAAAARVVDQLDLVDVEAELVEPADPLGDPVPLLVPAA